MHPDHPWEDDEDRVVPIARARTRSRGQDDRVQGKGMAEAPRTIAVSRAHLGLEDIFGLLLREIWLMLVIFAVLFGIGLAVAMTMQSTYTANAALLMQLSRDYVYHPTTNDAANGATATIDQIVQAETSILNANDLKKRVVAKVGYKVVLPDSPALWAPKTEYQKAQADAAALKVIQGGFNVSTAPATSVVNLSFKHRNAMSASLILNTMIDEYQAYRREVVYGDTAGPALERQRDTFSEQLAQTDAEVQDFLAQNGIGDFEAARTTYGGLFTTVTADLYSTESQIATVRAKLREIEANLATLSPEISTERDLDLTLPNKIADLKRQRQELLGRYQPTAQPVKDIDANIASMQALMDGGNAVGEQTHKLGTNPTYQAVLGQKMDMEAELSSLEARHAQLQTQADQITGKLHDLLGMQARYSDLSAERDALQEQLKAYAQRSQENAATHDMAKSADETVRVVERPSLPDRAKSLKRVVLILSFLFAGFTALCAGLLRVYMRKGFANAGMASRALDLPVLATARKKAA